MKLRRKISAFTLIELLVVIAVISILAAILFPVFARARESARRSSCLSNLKQLGLSMMMYAQDHDEHITPSFTENSPYYLPGYTAPRTTQLWYHMLYPYVKNRQIMNCPSATPPIVWNTTSYTGGIPYAINWAKPPSDVCPANCGISLAPSKSAGASLGAIEDAAGTILLLDSWYYRFQYKAILNESQALNPPFASGRCADEPNETSQIERCFAPRHMETGNVLFVDGHVKALQWQRVVGSSDSYKYWISTTG